MKLEMVVMAAGMGSRFGGVKQLEAVGPAGETMMDFAVHDALAAGVERVVFVIRRELEADFRAQVASRYEDRVEVACAFQDLDDLPAGHRPPEGRTKPWGTGHAVLAARHHVEGPFIVINADDFYGAHAFQALAGALREPAAGPLPVHAMVAFRLANTLSPHGTVARGLCDLTASGTLAGIREHTGIRALPGGGADEAGPGGLVRFTGEEPVSMNMWGFRPGMMAALEGYFKAFLSRLGGDPKAEFYLPAAVDALIQEGRAQVRVLETPGRWFGITYKEDRARVQAEIRALVAAGQYPKAGGI